MSDIKSLDLSAISARTAPHGIQPVRTSWRGREATVSLHRASDGLYGAVSFPAEWMDDTNEERRLQIFNDEIDSVIVEMNSSKLVDGKVWRRRTAIVWVPSEYRPHVGQTIADSYVTMIDCAIDRVTLANGRDADIPSLRVHVTANGADLGRDADGEVLW